VRQIRKLTKKRDSRVRILFPIDEYENELTHDRELYLQVMKDAHKRMKFAANRKQKKDFFMSPAKL
jgi:hypothetical protein